MLANRIDSSRGQLSLSNPTCRLLVGVSDALNTKYERQNP